MRSHTKHNFSREGLRDENTLFIEDLDPEISEADLRGIFQKYGNIYKISILKLPEPVYHAFVCFSQEFEAQQAKKACQYLKLGNHNIRIMIKNEHRTFSSGSKLLVENLDKSVSLEGLHKYFGQVGEVAYVNIKDNKGVIQYRTVEDAKIAIRQFHGMKIKDQIISVSEFCDASKRNLYFKNIPSLMSDGELEMFMSLEFSQFGEIESLKIQQDSNTQKYFGFVCFTNLESALKAYYVLNTTPLTLKGCSEELYLNWTDSQAHKLNLFVKNIRPDVSENEVASAFSYFGKVRNVVLSTIYPKNHNQAYKSGNIIFIFPENAEAALRSPTLHPAVLSLFLHQNPYIAYHESRDERSTTLKPKQPTLTDPKNSELQGKKKPLKLQTTEFNPKSEANMLVKDEMQAVGLPNQKIYAKEVKNTEKLATQSDVSKIEESEKEMELFNDADLVKEGMYYPQIENNTDVIKQIRKEKTQEALSDKLIQLLNDNFNDDLALQIKSHFELSEESSTDLIKQMIENKETFRTVIGGILFDIYTAKKTKHEVDFP